MDYIKRYDQEIYETKIEGDSVKIKFSYCFVSLVNIVIILNIYPQVFQLDFHSEPRNIKIR